MPSRHHVESLPDESDDEEDDVPSSLAEEFGASSLRSDLLAFLLAGLSAAFLLFFFLCFLLDFFLDFLSFPAFFDFLSFLVFLPDLSTGLSLLPSSFSCFRFSFLSFFFSICCAMMRITMVGLVKSSDGLIGQGGMSSPPQVSVKKVSGRHAESLPSQNRSNWQSSLWSASFARSRAYLLVLLPVTFAPAGTLVILLTSPSRLLRVMQERLPWSSRSFCCHNCCLSMALFLEQTCFKTCTSAEFFRSVASHSCPERICSAVIPSMARSAGQLGGAS
mmetsp:Transcript_8240/g.30106  ORF Transcript_8240/g.30106 Transcript_8240/m.30106 type:complete len:276 (+) Transcript_8240:83-910(+)